MLLISVLDPLHPVLHLGGDLARLLVLGQATVNQLALPADTPDGADDGGGAGAEGLNQPALGGGLGQVAHGVLALGDEPALRDEPLAGEGEDRVAGDALEDGAVQGRGDELLLARLLVAQGDEHVHGADLGDVLLLAEQPQVLGEAAAHGVALRHDAGRVVGAQLLVADAAWPGAHGVVGGLERDGLEACGVVGPDGAGDDVQQGAARRADAEGLLRADHGGPQVERIAALRWDEALVELGELGDQVDHGSRGEGRQGDASGGAVEALHVLVWAEEADLALGVLVGLHALEALEGIVEDARRGVEGEVLVWRDAGGEPAGCFVPLDGEHVVWRRKIRVRQSSRESFQCVCA